MCRVVGFRVRGSEGPGSLLFGVQHVAGSGLAALYGPAMGRDK